MRAIGKVADESATNETATQPAADPGPVYFLLHIPRTAGQTIQYHLMDHAAPGLVWLPRRAGRLAALSGRRHDLDGLGDPRRVRAVAGHDVGRSLEAHFRGREIRRVVLLRDPVDHQLSLYNYRMMNHLNKGLGTYSFDVHVRAQPRDWVAHRLLADWLEIPWLRLMAMSDAEKYRILNRMLAEFWFVGSYADCDRLIAAIAPDFGVPSQAQVRNTAQQWRRQIYWEPLTAEALGPAGRKALLRRNPIDLALWESWGAAGFDAAAVEPRPLAATPRWGFVADEAARRAYAAARSFRRDVATRLRVGRSMGGLRSGFAKADRALHAGQWELAAEHYRRGLAEEPRAPAIWVQYGHVLKKIGKLGAAEEAYRQSLRVDPDSADTYAQLGHVLALQGRAAEAAEAYRHALALDAALDEAVVGLRALGTRGAISENRGSE